VPNFLPVTFRIVAPTPDDLPFPIWQLNPIGSIKEKRGLQENAADLVVVRSTRIRGSSISGDPRPHLPFSSCPVLFSKCLPNNAGGQDREVAEESTADDVIVRAMQFEEERLTDLESPELLLPAWLPEVDLVEPVQAGQEIEPITIRDTDEEAHTLSCKQIK